MSKNTRPNNSEDRRNLVYTPGPWDICVSNNSNLIHVEVALDAPARAGEQVCTVNRGDKAQRLANASLIAAAPELLEAYREALNWIADQEADPLTFHAVFAIMGRAEALLAKAEGRQS